jgi:nucleoside-diphosphate-sugar epimerase
VAAVYACVADLMLGSRVSESLRAAGHEVTLGARLPEPEAAAGFDLVVCDLEGADPAELAALDVPSLGFYSHVDVETRRRATGAGVDLVVPRSRMSRELPDLVAGLL